MTNVFRPLMAKGCTVLLNLLVVLITTLLAVEITRIRWSVDLFDVNTFVPSRLQIVSCVSGAIIIWVVTFPVSPSTNSALEPVGSASYDGMYNVFPSGVTTPRSTPNGRSTLSHNTWSDVKSTQATYPFVVGLYRLY